MSEILISPNRNHKIISAFLHVFCDSFFFLKLFYTFDKAMHKLSFFTRIFILIMLYMSRMWKQFPDERYIRKHRKKEHNIFFGSRLEILTFKTYFTESKTLTGGQFFQ